ncbi:MAG: DUF4443 domain-containing protein [archaeon]
MVGNQSNFSCHDVVRCFLLLRSRGSRAFLMDALELGEGTVRSILDLLKTRGLVTSTKGGHSYTPAGEALHQQVNTIIGEMKRVQSDSLYPGFNKAALVVKAPDCSVRLNYELRDVAIRAGADGAVIFVYDRGLKLPDSGYQEDFSEFERPFDLKEGHLLILSFAKTYRMSESGAIAVALKLNRCLRESLAQLSNVPG